MAKIDMDGSSGSFPSPDRLRLKLPHKARLNATVSGVSPVWETESYSGDSTVENITIFFRKEVDELAEELDLDDDQVEALHDRIEQYNESVVEANEEIDDRDLDMDDYELLPEGVVELRMIVTANLTRGEQAQHHSNLYKTLRAVDLVDPSEESPTAFSLLDHDGNEVNPFEELGPNDNDAINEALTTYLNQNLAGVEVEVEVKNVNRDNAKDEYSMIGEVIREV